MAGGIGIKLSTKPKLSEVAKPFRASYIKDIDREIRETSNQVYLNIIGEAPKRSGDLIKAIVIKRRSVLNYEIFVDKRTKGGKYESFVRLGVPAEKINPITPKKKKALYWPGARHPVKAVYNHPGIKANDYWSRGLQKSERDFEQFEVIVGTKISKKLMGE